MAEKKIKWDRCRSYSECFTGTALEAGQKKSVINQPPNRYDPKRCPWFLGPLYSGRETKMDFRMSRCLVSKNYFEEIGTGHAASQKETSVYTVHSVGLLKTASCTQVYVIFSITNKGFWPAPQKISGIHLQLDHPGSQVARSELLDLLWGKLNIPPTRPTRVGEHQLWH